MPKKARSGAKQSVQTMDICAREYVQGESRLLAACDADILGQTFREGKLQLAVSESFYDGRRVSAEELVLLMRRCTIGNFSGKHVVALAVEMGIVDEANVLTIGGVPHAQYAVL